MAEDLQLLIDNGDISSDSIEILNDHDFAITLSGYSSDLFVNAATISPVWGGTSANTSSFGDGPVGAGLHSTASERKLVHDILSPSSGSSYYSGIGLPSLSFHRDSLERTQWSAPSPVGGGWHDVHSPSPVGGGWHDMGDWCSEPTFSDYKDCGSLDCFKYDPYNNNKSFSLNMYGQRQSYDWYWSYVEGRYKCIDKFSSKADLYQYPLIFPDIYDLPAIVEEPASNGCGTASCVVATNEYICSGDCLDEYTLSGNEESLWAAIDDHACAGASISEAVRAKWMPFCDNTPP